MGDFHAEVVELQRAQALLKLAERKLSDWSPIITRAYHRLDSQQNGTITNVRGAIVGWGRIYDAQWERIKKMISFIDTAMAEMEQAEEQAYKELADAEIREDKKESGNTKPAAGKPGASANPNQQQGASDVVREMQERYQRLIAISTRKTYDGFCGAFVFQQLKDQGILNGGVPVYGKDYYSHFASQSKTSTGYSIESYGEKNGLTNLLNANQGKILRNIVVSFDPYGRIYPSGAGHVMLITQIKDGKVYYMDNGSIYPDGTRHKEGVPACQSLEEFLRRYPNMNGVVHFYK